MTPSRPEQTEFAPSPVQRGRRRGDAVAGVLVALVILGVGLAMVKPWQGAGEAGASAPHVPSVVPSVAASAAIVRAPTWADIGPVISAHDAWGIRAITADAAYDELWQPAADAAESAMDVASAAASEAKATIVAPGRASVLALGVTFPPTEVPLDVRVWLDHGDDGLEWIDARPVNQLPGLGGYLLVRPGPDDSTARPWAPGRYRIDVLVGHRIRRFDVAVRDASGSLPSPSAWRRPPIGFEGLSAVGLANVAPGSGGRVFVWGGTAPVVLAAEAGPALDETEAWLDLDRSAGGDAHASVGRVFLPFPGALGVVLPPGSAVEDEEMELLAPDPAMLDGDPISTMVSPGDLSFVAFARASGAAWWPGVYVLHVVWSDDTGRHDRTWHVELLPGNPHPEPWLLAATRAWAGFAGSPGILLGTTSDAPASTGVSLLPVTPQSGDTYPGLTGIRVIGCGETLVRGHPTVIGLVGVPGTDTPVTAAVVYPVSAAGPMETLTSSGAVRGLTLVMPRIADSFEGPAGYAFWIGPSLDTPQSYTVCIDRQPPG